MRDYVLYSDVKTHEAYLEIWNSSTKHPDEKFRFSHWIEMEVPKQYRNIYSFENAWIQWLAWIASIQTFPCVTQQILSWITDIIKYRDNKGLQTTL